MPSLSSAETGRINVHEPNPHFWFSISLTTVPPVVFSTQAQVFHISPTNQPTTSFFDFVALAEYLLSWHLHLQDHSSAVTTTTAAVAVAAITPLHRLLSRARHVPIRHSYNIFGKLLSFSTIGSTTMLVKRFLVSVTSRCGNKTLHLWNSTFIRAHKSYNKPLKSNSSIEAVAVTESMIWIQQIRHQHQHHPSIFQYGIVMQLFHQLIHQVNAGDNVDTYFEKENQCIDAGKYKLLIR